MVSRVVVCYGIITMPRVSTILPTFNGSRTIARAIESVLAQSFTDYELIVVDDGSTDGTAQVVRSFSERDPRVRLIQNAANLGLQKSLNVGLAAAAGEYIARIDDDDRWIDPGKLAAQVSFLDANPRYAVVGAQASVADAAGTRLSVTSTPIDDQNIRRAMLFVNPFVHISVMYRKSVVMEAGGYSEDPAVNYLEDYDLWMRLGRSPANKFASLKTVAVEYEMSNRTTTGKNKLQQTKNILRRVQLNSRYYPRAQAGVCKAYMRVIVDGYLRLSGLRYRIKHWVQHKI